MDYRTLGRIARRVARFLKYCLDRQYGPYIVFDVGSSNGKQFLRRCREDSNTIVYAFEPEPESFKTVLENSKGLPNFHAYPLAVSDVDGEKTFNVASVVGNHSLYEFVEDVNEVWKRPYAEQISWVPDFHKKRQIMVKTIRLDTFISEMGIPHISYLHIDAQGEDLNILRSLGGKIGLARAGVIEVCLKPLYRDQFTRDEAVDFLTASGFKITHTEVEHFGLVENIYFERPRSAHP